jgi:hypothetical protein
MNTALTTPIPLLGPGEKLAVTNRIAFQLRNALPDFPHPEQASTSWSTDPARAVVQTRQLNFEPIYTEMYNVIVAFVLHAWKAEANDQITRPFLLYGISGNRIPDLRCGQWFVQTKGPLNRIAAQAAVASPEQSGPQATFIWSTALYRARKAAQEFSQETHGDY